MRHGTKAKKTKILRAEKGIVLVAVALFTLVITFLGFGVLAVARNEITLVKKDMESMRAFYLAEAGLDMFCVKLSYGINEGIEDTELGGGTCRVDYYPNDPNAYSPYAIATGTYEGQTKQIMVDAVFLAPPFECAIFAGGYDGTTWTLQSRGTGNPVPKSGGEYGGKDMINGNLYVRGDVGMYEQSSVNPPLGANPFNLQGDVDATGNIDLYDTATIAGDANEGAPELAPPDLLGMNYAVNNTHNVSQIFAGETLDWRGRLPVGHPLRDVFCKNPTYDRSAECASTTGDDYFLEPASGYIEGNWKTAPTPLHAGNDRVYYIDGNLWVNSKSDTYGFNMDGKVTIVVTGDIFICDNLAYADADSMLGLVALGKYDEYGDLDSGGNVIFGDPAYGTMYICSAMMFAANDFMFNSKTFGEFPTEPESGFTVTGCISALNRVSIERDWYTQKTWNPFRHRWVETRRPCYHQEHASDVWKDSITGAALTPTEKGTIKHYQMIVNYDDRVRSRDTQPPMLPKGVGTIFEGLKNWEELP